MKGLEHTLVIIVTAIVVLIVAVVLLTIFGRSLIPVSSIIEMENICRQKAVIACRTTGQMPPDWNTQFTVRNERGDPEPFSCTKVGNGCSAFLGGSSQPSTTPQPSPSPFRPSGPI